MEMKSANVRSKGDDHYQSAGAEKHERTGNRRFYSGLVGFDFQLGPGARLGIVGLGFDFFIRGDFQNSPQLGGRRARHIVYRVDRFDYLGECDRFLGVIIISWYEERVSCTEGYSFLYWRYLKL